MRPLVRVPVTVLTGFLGAGKTTLLNHLLSEKHGLRFAIIENEFGEVGIDEKILGTEIKEKIDEESIEVMTGCICCTVRGDLVRVLAKALADPFHEAKREAAACVVLAARHRARRWEGKLRVGPAGREVALSRAARVLGTHINFSCPCSKPRPWASSGLRADRTSGARPIWHGVA